MQWSVPRPQGGGPGLINHSAARCAAATTFATGQRGTGQAPPAPGCKEVRLPRPPLRGSQHCAVGFPDIRCRSFGRQCHLASQRAGEFIRKSVQSFWELPRRNKCFPLRAWSWACSRCRCQDSCNETLSDLTKVDSGNAGGGGTAGSRCRYRQTASAAPELYAMRNSHHSRRAFIILDCGKISGGYQKGLHGSS